MPRSAPSSDSDAIVDRNAANASSSRPSRMSIRAVCTDDATESAVVAAFSS